MNPEQLNHFTDNWLSSWTGNRPDLLLEYYTEDAYYLDPANPQGLKGKDQMKAYFTKLLAKNPDWVWTSVEIMPTEKGFTLKWKAEIPLPTKTLTIFGLDIVELIDGKISRNEVYFDRLDWMEILKGSR